MTTNICNSCYKLEIWRYNNFRVVRNAIGAYPIENEGNNDDFGFFSSVENETQLGANACSQSITGAQYLQEAIESSNPLTTQILERVVSVRPIDLYKQISRICPAERDICIISSEEVASRLSFYNTKLTLEHKITTEESEFEQSNSGEREEGFFREVKFEDVGLIEEQCLQEHTMRNIFDECDNNGGWIHLEYFELN